MALQMTLSNVVPTQDGPTRCFDAVVSAGEISRYANTGFLEIGTEHQRREDSVGGRHILDRGKVEKWAEQLILGEAYLGQLSWNFRKGETVLNYDEENRTLSFDVGTVTIPDSYNRHKAILNAVESVGRGSQFDLNRKFSVRIYNVSANEESKISYELNREGRRANPARSKWVHPEGVTRIAVEFVNRSRHLQRNVDTVQHRLSQRNSRLCSFNTLSHAFERHWSNTNPDDQEARQRDVEYLVQFWDKLASVRPELGKMDIRSRLEVRDTLVVDSAIAITAYIAIANRMKAEDKELDCLKQLGQEINADGEWMDFFSRKNPLWKENGVLVPVTGRDRNKRYIVSNTLESRQAMLAAVSKQVGVNL